MEHTSIGDLLAIGGTSEWVSQVERVAHICRAQSFFAVPDFESARASLRAYSKLQPKKVPDLILVEARRPLSDMIDFLAKFRKSPEPSLAGVGLLILCSSWAESKEVLSDLLELNLPLQNFPLITQTLVKPCTDLMLEESLERLSSISAPNPRHLSVLKGAFEAMLRLTPEQAREYLKFSRAKHPNSSEYKCIEAILTQSRGEHEEVVMLCKRYLKDHPGFEPLMHVLAASSVALGDLETACASLEGKEHALSGKKFAIKFDTFSSISRSLNNEGIKLTKSGDLKAAERIYLLALVASERFPDRHRYLLTYNLGKNYQRQRNFEKALDCYLKASKIAPNDFAEPMFAYTKVLELLKKDAEESIAFARSQESQNIALENQNKVLENSEFQQNNSVRDFDLKVELGGGHSLENLEAESDSSGETASGGIDNEKIFSIDGLEDFEIDDPFGDLESGVLSPSKTPSAPSSHNALDALRGFEFSSEFDESLPSKNTEESEAGLAFITETVISTSEGMSTETSQYEEAESSEVLAEDQSDPSMHREICKARLAFIMFETTLPVYRKKIEDIRSRKVTPE